MKRIEIKLPLIDPDIGWMELIQWLIEVGQNVEMDQDLAELKMGNEIFRLPAPEDGKIVKLSAEPGEVVTPGQVLAVIKIG